MDSGWIASTKKIAGYERRRPKKYRSCGWKFYNGYYRGAKYGRILPETGYMFFTTQAWDVLRKCWLGYKIAKAHDDFEKMEYYAEGIRRAQKELGLQVDSFPDLGIWDNDVNSRKGPKLGNSINEDESCGYESEAQRKYRQRMEQPYESSVQKAWRERIQRYY